MSDHIVIGIETSCDETAVALVVGNKVVSDFTTTQILHQKYGGVVPELASRAHEKLLAATAMEVIADTGIEIDSIDAVAVTYGPGLAGALLVGVSFAKGLAQCLGVPLIGVNHLEGHLWSVEMTAGEIPKPILALIASGGHTLIVKTDGLDNYETLGKTRDDAVGELFDKVGRKLDFKYPAGGRIDREALSTEKEITLFPRAKLKNDPYGFSFSGLKTSVLYYLRDNYREVSGKYDIHADHKAEICRGIMNSVADMLTAPLKTALSKHDFRSLVISGGVAASGFLRRHFEEISDEYNVQLYIPPPRMCTDNGAMIAFVGAKYFAKGKCSDINLAINPSLHL